jgi:hypothetical protein
VKEQGRIAHRVILAAAALPLLLLVLSANPNSAKAQTGSSIADTALQYVGTHGGQCWTFMQQVVLEATGRRVGYDYRQGYFQAGAVEVPASEATTGDIIQIAADSNTSPGASYPGLHTAIILENLGGGVFDAVDSNQNWDEMVRLRPNYDPYASAARYGLQVHIYRMPEGSAQTVSWDADNVDGIPATVSTGGDCLYLRSGAGLRTSGLGCLPNGTSVKVTGEAVVADGYTWVPVATSRGTGWVAGEYLSGIDLDAAPAESGAIGASAPDPAPTPAPAQAAPPAAQAPESGSGDHVPVGWIRTDGSPGCLYLRDAPTTAGTVVDCLAAYTRVRLVNDTSTPANGFVWVNVETSSGRMGYVASEYLIP